MYEHNALGYRSGLALCLTKVRSSRARCPATALIKCAKTHWVITTQQISTSMSIQRIHFEIGIAHIKNISEFLEVLYNI